MKRLVRLIAFCAIAASALVACQKYDDSALKSDISNLQSRVSSLESKVNDANSNISALQTIVNALNKNVFVTGVTEIADGYTIKFSDGTSATIKNGKNGQNGQNGQDGNSPKMGVKKDTDGIYYWTVDGQWLLDSNGKKVKAEGVDGQNGEDGDAGHTPVIGVKQDEDGVYYWTVDGQWLLDAQGNKVPTAGKDGANGSDGENGADGITPQLRIQDGKWQVSLDEGKTWTDVPANGDYVIIKSVDTSDPSFVLITLQDGTVLKLARGASGVQSIVAIPYFNDGSVQVINDITTLKFRVFPESAAEAVAALGMDCFKLDIVYTATKAAEVGDATSLTIIDVALEDNNIAITFDGCEIDNDFFAKKIAANAILSIDDGAVCVNTGYVSLFPILFGRGTAPVKKSAGRTNNECAWVQLWEGGPKFAEFNVGATIDDYNELDYSEQPDDGWREGYNTANVGGLYPWHNSKLDARIDAWDDDVDPFETRQDVATSLWGSNWRAPSLDEMIELKDKCVWTFYDGSVNRLNENTKIAGYMVSGVPGTKYENNYIFLPCAGVYNVNYGSAVLLGRVGHYWSSSPYYDAGINPYPYHLGFDDEDYLDIDPAWPAYGFSIRAVLKEGEDPIKGKAPVSTYAKRPNDECGWVQLWKDGPKFAEFNIGATIDDYGNLDTEDEYYDGYIKGYNTANIGGLYAMNNPFRNARKVYWDMGVDTDLCSDVASYLWGAAWRMPTKTELEELINNCEWTWINGETNVYCEGCYLAGYKVSGKSGTIYADNSIFLPAGGYYFPEYGMVPPDDTASYRSSTTDSERQSIVFELYFYHYDDSTVSESYVISYYDYVGDAIRPVFVE